MPYVKAEDTRKVFLDLEKIPGENKVEKAKTLGISKQLFYKYQNKGLILKTAKIRGFEKYLEDNNKLFN